MRDLQTRLREFAAEAGSIVTGDRTTAMMAADEIDRLTLENWQLKGALGYAVPGDVPPGDFKCGLCEARNNQQKASGE